MRRLSGSLGSPAVCVASAVRLMSPPPRDSAVAGRWSPMVSSSDNSPRDASSTSISAVNALVMEAISNTVSSVGTTPLPAEVVP